MMGLATKEISESLPVAAARIGSVVICAATVNSKNSERGFERRSAVT